MSVWVCVSVFLLIAVPNGLYSLGKYSYWFCGGYKYFLGRWENPLTPAKIQKKWG